MKTLGTVLKILAALAAIAGVVYVVATYGDKIVAWAKQLWSRVSCCGESEFIPAQEAVEEITVEEDAVQAEEKDFEG